MLPAEKFTQSASALKSCFTVTKTRVFKYIEAFYL